MTQQLVYVNNKVDNSKIRRTTNERGDEVIIIPSHTLPDDIVMNRLKYPKEVIERDWHTIEGTLAPIGHPFNDDGEYISATEAQAIDYFYAGVVNKNAMRVKDENYGHRVYVEKWINVAVANTTERGKRLLAAIEAEQPIHTSTGILVDVDYSNPTDEIDGVVLSMVLDHDAILLDEEGAATPDDGVGLFVNGNLLKQVKKSGQQMQVNTVTIKANESNRDKEAKVRAAISGLMPDKEYRWMEDWGDDYAVIGVEDGCYKVSYSYVDKKVEIVGDPEPVRKVTKWESIVNAAKNIFNRGKKATQANHNEGVDMFKEHIQSVLKANAVDFSAMSDQEQIAKYDEIKGNAANTTTEPKGAASVEPVGELEVNADLQKLVNDAVAKALQANAQQAEKAEREQLTAEITANSKDFTAEELAETSVAMLRKIAANSKPAHVSFGVAGGRVNAAQSQADQMPE